MQRWTEKEIEFLKKYYPIKGMKYVVKKLKRTPDGIGKKISQYGLRYENSNAWHKWEISVLKRTYQSKNIQSISRTLKRTPIAIKAKAKKLNLIIPNNTNSWTPEQIEKLKKMYPDRSYSILQIAEIVNHPYQTVCGMARKLKIRRPYLFTSIEDDFIRKHYKKMTYKEMGDQLGRSQPTISYRVKLLGFHKRTLRQWTKKETDFLKENYKSMSLENMCKKLKRNLVSVNAKGRELKITKYKIKAWSSEDKDFVIRNFCIMPIDKIAKKVNRSTDSVYRIANKFITYSEIQKRRKIFKENKNK